MIPRRWAASTASARVPTSSLRKMLATCVRAVAQEMNNSSAISWFERPATIRRKTSTSRPVKPARVSDDAGRLPKRTASASALASAGRAPSAERIDRASASSLRSRRPSPLPMYASTSGRSVNARSKGSSHASARSSDFDNSECLVVLAGLEIDFSQQAVRAKPDARLIEIGGKSERVDRSGPRSFRVSFREHQLRPADLSGGNVQHRLAPAQPPVMAGQPAT